MADRVDAARPRSAGASLGDRLHTALTNPVRLVPAAYLGVILLGTGLLMVPAATPSGRTDPQVAAFTAVSAVCVTGLATVDTATYWTPLGQAFILVLIQVGGLGIMTLATLLSLLVRGRLGVVGLLRVRVESHAFDSGSVSGLIRTITLRVLLAEAAFSLALAVRFRIAHDDSWGPALGHGLLHGVSAFNNAGFAWYSDSLIPFASDVWIITPICLAIIAGGIGYPVFFELASRWRRPDSWTAHTRITVYGTLLLLGVGMAAYLLFEWSNPGTLGPKPVWEKVLSAGTASVVARTAGFSGIDYTAITPAVLVITVVLMFIGGGSAGTAGGIKVTTFFLLGHVILSEARGERDVIVGHRRIGSETIRQALSVALLGVGVVSVGAIALVVITGGRLDGMAFEAVSAFATAGLSVGVTPTLPVAGQWVVMGLMFVGRVGTITLASALAMHNTRRHYRYPEERPIVG